MSTTVTEAFENIDDQLENIKAIKGKTYAKVVAFVITNYSLAVSILKVVSYIEGDEKSIGEALDDIGEMMNAVSGSTITNYCKAVDFDMTLYDEAIADGKRIVASANEHIERSMKA